MSIPARIAGFAAIAAALLAATGTAMAEQSKPDTGFVARLFAGPTDRAANYACFVRVYDADHLARHRLQKVGAMKLLVTAEKDPETKGLNYSFRLGVKYRDRTGAFDSSGSCGHTEISEENLHEAKLGCGVDCDGGGLSAELAQDNKSVLIRLERIRIWRNNAPDEEASGELTAGADDKAFRLDRAKLGECASLVTDRKELAAMRRIK